MNFVRRALAILSFVAAASMAMNVYVASDAGFISNTIKSHEIENTLFKETSLRVDDYLRRNQRLPTTLEMKAVFPDFRYEIQSDVTSFPPLADSTAVALANRELAGIGTPPKSLLHPYLLVDWGYDKPLFWASWAQQGNAFTEQSHFYTFGTRGADLLFYCTSTFILLCMTIFLWRLPKPSIDVNIA
jgi:hypothetical protein